MTLTMPVAPPAYWAENCFAISPVGLPAPTPPPAPGTHSATMSCAWVPVGAPPPLSNIRVVKTALHGGKALTRVTVNSMAPGAGAAVSVAEDVIAVGSTTLMTFLPLVFLGLLALCLIGTVWLAPKIARALRRMPSPIRGSRRAAGRRTAG